MTHPSSIAHRALTGPGSHAQSGACGVTGPIELRLCRHLGTDDGRVLSSAALADMVTVDDTFGIGLGGFPVCPCTTGPDGTPQYASIGHNGGQVSVLYSPADGLVIAVSLTESLWTPFLGEADVYNLLAEIRTVV